MCFGLISAIMLRVALFLSAHRVVMELGAYDCVVGYVCGVFCCCRWLVIVCVW